MEQFNWTRWFKSFLGRKPGTVIRRERVRLNLEALEQRLAPAARVWDGGGADDRWTTAANWVGDIAPVVNDDLTFQAVAARKFNQNDFVGQTFNSLSFSGTGYSIVGNQFTLGTSAFNSGSLIVNAGASTNSLGLDIQLGGAAGNRQFFTVGSAGAVLNVNGKLLGSTGVELAKDGVGTLVLAADNSAYTGQITVSQGILRVTNAKALGDALTGTTIAANAQIQVSSVAGTILEPLLINGNGLTNDGALLAIAGSNGWAGDIVMVKGSNGSKMRLVVEALRALATAHQ